MPVLQFHGLADTALLANSLNNTWEELDQDWTLVTLPGVGHFPHHDKPEKVTNMMKAWLDLQIEQLRLRSLVWPICWDQARALVESEAILVGINRLVGIYSSNKCRKVNAKQEFVSAY